MDKKGEGVGSEYEGHGEPAVRLGQRERSVANRETWVRARELVTGEHDIVIAEREEEVTAREELVRAREETLQARAEADRAHADRERILVQMREANEQLVVSTIRADELAEEAEVARETIAKHAAALEAQDRAKDEFLAMLAHELRSPLAPIASTLDIMVLTAPDVLVKERGVIEGQVKQLVRIVDDLLDISRVTQGKITLDIEPVDLAAIVERAVETVAPLIDRKAQTLRVDVPAYGLVVDGDFIRLAQVVGNLLSNAAKFTPVHGVIDVIGERRGANVVIRVVDNGHGIAAEMLSRVFDLFVQEARSHDRAHGGLGLGLTIAQRLVQMNGGSITARSDGIGYGSEFEVILPASQHTAPLLPEEKGSSLAASAVRVLVVDDNQSAAEASSILLTLLGYVVRVAYDGATALSIAPGFAPEIALLDIGLPGMDGYELARRLRDVCPPEALRLIAVSGYGQEWFRARSMAAGFDEHLVKPVELGDLTAALARAILRLQPSPVAAV